MLVDCISGLSLPMHRGLSESREVRSEASGMNPGVFPRPKGGVPPCGPIQCLLALNYPNPMVDQKIFRMFLW